MPPFRLDICSQANRKGLTLQSILIACAMTNLFLVKWAGPKSLYVFNLCV